MDSNVYQWSKKIYRIIANPSDIKDDKLS